MVIRYLWNALQMSQNPKPPVENPSSKISSRSARIRDGSKNSSASVVENLSADIGREPPVRITNCKFHISFSMTLLIIFRATCPPGLQTMLLSSGLLACLLLRSYHLLLRVPKR